MIVTLHMMAPSHKFGSFAGRLERFAPWSFKPREHIALRWGSHHRADALAGNVVEWRQTDRGLFARCRIDLPRHRIEDMIRRVNPADRLSVGCDDGAEEHVQYDADGRIITRYTVDHFAVGLTADGAAHPQTAVWPVELLSNKAPSRIRDAAASFAREWQSADRVANFVTEARARKKAKPPTSKADRLAVALAPRLARYREVREAFAVDMMQGRTRGIILGHAAFTRQAGFDGDFTKLCREVRAKHKGDFSIRGRMRPVLCGQAK
jgi:hypothetical protein